MAASTAPYPPSHTTTPFADPFSSSNNSITSTDSTDSEDSPTAALQSYNRILYEHTKRQMSVSVPGQESTQAGAKPVNAMMQGLRDESSADSAASA